MKASHCLEAYAKKSSKFPALVACLDRQVLLKTILRRRCLPLISHMLRITNKNQGTRTSFRLVQQGSQYLIHFEEEIFYSLARPSNVVCVCSIWFFSSEKECWKPECGCVGGPDEPVQLWLRTLFNHALGTQLFKSLSERNTQIRSHLEQNCAKSNHAAVNKKDLKKNLI